jgi:hypothetical protein
MSTYDFSFDSVKSRITNNLKSKASFANILTFGVNSRIIDAVSEEISDLAQYAENLTIENKWSLARNLSSLMTFENIDRYSAHRKKGAIGKIRFGVDPLINSLEWLSTTTYIINDVVYSQDDILFYSLVNSNLNHEPPLQWLDLTSYNLGNFVYYNGLLYQSLSGSNLGNQPDLTPSKWTVVTDDTYWTLKDISNAKTIGINKYTTVSDVGGNYKFVTTYSDSLVAGENYIDIDVVQGTAKTFSVIAAGTDNEEFTLSVSNIENDYFDLYVNGVLWTRVNNLLEYEATDKVYEIENMIDFSGVYLKFGNDIYGKKLTSGDTIIFYYVATDGIDGNISSIDIIKKIQTILYDVDSTKVTAYCTNRETLAGGLDYEDIESIRLNAPKITQAGDRASNISDYQIIINGFNFVLKNIVWGAYEYNIDHGFDPWTYIAIEENVVHVAAISTAGSNLNTAQKLLISAGINEYKSPTDIVTFETVRFLNIAFRSIVYVSNTSYTLTSIVANVKSALSTAYNINSLNFHESIYFSDYQALIDNLAGVDHHTTYAEIYYDYTLGASYYLALTLPSQNIKPSSIQIYIEDTVAAPGIWSLLATDDGVGGFDAQYGYTIINDQIIYITGVGALYVSSGLSNPYTNYTVRIYYQLNTNDLILYERTDIFLYSTESTVTASYMQQS